MGWREHLARKRTEPSFSIFAWDSLQADLSIKITLVFSEPCPQNLNFAVVVCQAHFACAAADGSCEVIA